MSPDAPISILRFTLRAANAFILDMLVICRGARDFTDALIMTTLTQCNSAPLAGDYELQKRYAAFESPPPASMLRPISINAIATSLGLPFETVRRRTKALIVEGVCEAAPDGVRFREEALVSPEQRRMIDETYATVRTLYRRLRRAGCLELMELPDRPFVSWEEASPPVRIVWRAASDYALRMMEHLLPNVPTLSQGFVLLAVFRANTDELPDAIRGGEGVEVEDFVPDSFRRPARASDVAALLGMPHETVRRHLAALLEAGRCVRVRDGVVVPARLLARRNVLGAWGPNFRYLARMFAELAEMGVLALWDAEIEVQNAA
jgi:DNA-binding IclR family transcriptional regulator